MKEDKKEDRKKISIELMAMAQAAYQQAAKEERAAQGNGQKSQLALNPGWGGQGR